MSQNIEILEKKIYELVGYSFNILSTKQLVKALYEDLKLPVKDRTSSGNPSTNEETLKKLSNDYEIAQLILDYRKIVKSVNSNSSNLDAAENVDDQQNDIKVDIQQNKIPKPGMPQPRQVLESNPNADLLNLLNRNPNEILNDDSVTNTGVFVAKDEEYVDTNQENSTTDKENEFVPESNDVDDIGTTDKSISTPSSFSLSAEQKNNFSIIKSKGKQIGNSKETEKKKGNLFDDELKENEFSKNSIKMNVKNSSKESNLENKQRTNKIAIAIVCVFILIIITVLAIFLNSVSSMN